MFITHQIHERLIVIGEQDETGFVFAMQLVIGDARAALIDCGMGYDHDLMKVIRSYTALPVVLLITHGHDDHVGNAALFDARYMNPSDASKLPHPFSFAPLADGDMIDLGNVVLEVFAMPGHTDGAVCFLNTQEHYALTGDSVNQETWLCWDDCASPKEYARQIQKFQDRMESNQITSIFDGHSMNCLPAGICQDMMRALEEVSEGKTSQDLFHHLEKTNGKKAYQHVCGNSKIIYCPAV